MGRPKPIPESVVAAVVKEASERMSDPQYVQMIVGAWVQEQPNTTQYLTAHVKELGSAEAVVNAVFHAALVASAFARHAGRRTRKLTFADLDGASQHDASGDELRRRQPAVHDYLVANVAGPEMMRVLVLVALALDASA